MKWAIFVAIILVGCGPTPTPINNPLEDSPLTVGTDAPDFEVTALTTGSRVKLSSLKGKYVLIDFWATWCGPCKETLPHTEAIFKDLSAKGLQVLAISDEDKGLISKYWNHEGYKMPAYQDADDSANRAFKVYGLPSLVLVDPAGKIAFYSVGLEPESDIRDRIAKAGLN